MKHDAKRLRIERLQKASRMTIGIAVRKVEPDLLDAQFMQSGNDVVVDVRVGGRGDTDTGEIRCDIVIGGR